MSGELSIFAAAEASSAHGAIVAGGAVWSFAALAGRVRAAIGWLDERGVEERAALVASPRLDSLVMLLALIERGTTAVLLHPRLTEKERRELVAEACCETVIDERWTIPSREGRGFVARDPPSPRSTLAVLFTAGSTGKPKGVRLSRAAFVAAALASERNLGWRHDDRWLLALPFAHIGGLSIVTRCLAARRTVVLAEGGRASTEQIVAAVERDRVTLLSLVPTQVKLILDRRPRWDPPSYVRAILVGGAAASSTLLGEAADRRWPLRTTYGLTETCAQVATDRAATANRGEAGAGAPLDGIRVRIAGGGIEIHGPTLMDGYLGGAPDPFTADGWLCTGDLGRLDGEGRLHVLGRRDEVIVTGGENVDPVEVEQALERLPGVKAACVFGVPDPAWGQIVVAALAGPRPMDDAVLVGLLARELAPYKRPRQLAWLPALPSTTAGKLDRRASAELARPRLRPLSSAR